MRLPNQVKSNVRTPIHGIYCSSITEIGVHPAACCSGDNNPLCNLLGPRVRCPQGFTCRSTRICGREFCIPFGFCVAQNLTFGLG